MNKLDTNKIKSNPEKYIKWMCYDILISIDSQVFNLSLNSLKERLIGVLTVIFVLGNIAQKNGLINMLSMY